MNLELLHKLLEPICSENKVLKVYLFGSRVWGTAAEDADWDFFVVIEDYDGVVHPSLDLSLVGFQVDISAYSPEQWRQLLEDHDMLALVCEHLPLEFVWKDMYRTDFVLSLKNLVRGTSKEMSKCLSMSHVHFVKNGDRRTGLKNFVHATRYIGFATQLASHGALFDLGVANQRLSEVMALLNEPNKTYDDFLRIYKPQIMTMYSQFVDLIQGIISKELAFALSLGAPSTVLVAYLEKCPVTDLRRYFAIQSTRIRDQTYLLESTEDSPEGATITTACGCTIVRVDVPSVLAQFHGYVSSQSLDRPPDLALHQTDDSNQYLALPLPSDFAQVFMWFGSGSWEIFSLSSSNDSFLRSFEDSRFLYPDDTTLCLVWLHNTNTGELRPLSVSVGGVLRLDLMRKPLMNWPPFQLESFSSINDVFIRVSELETEPTLFKGLYLPHSLFGCLMESRSYRAYHDLQLHADFHAEESRVHHRLKHLALAICCFRTGRNQSCFPGLDSPSMDSIEREIYSCSQVVKACLFFWSHVQDKVDDPQEFTKAMTKLHYWHPVASIMTLIRNHVSRDPQTVLFVSPLRTYRYWAEVFEPSKISRLMESVSAITSSTASKAM